MSIVNALLVRWEGGYRWVEDAPSIAANGRSEAYLELGGLRSTEEVDRVGAAVLSYASVGRTASVARVRPRSTAETPYEGGWGPFDDVNRKAPDESISPAKVRGVTLGAGPDGRPTWTLELGDLVEDAETQFERWLRRRLSGALGGRTETTNPANPVSPIEDVQKGGDRLRWSKTGPLSAGVLDSDRETLGSGVHHLTYFTATLKTSGSSSSSLRIKRSGTTLYTVTIPSGVNVVYVPLNRDLVVQTDTLHLEVVTAGTGAAGLVGTLRYI